MQIKNSENPVPCGKCTLCRKRRASAWSFRLMQQDKISTNSHFITLTYSNENYNGKPNITVTDKGYMALNRRDVQQFMRRLRKAHSAVRDRRPLGTIKYYAAGEYGGQTGRPHYHIILFNAYPDLIESAWGRGQVHFGYEAGAAAIGYTLKYISKESQIPKHKNDDRPKEFSLISQGIGKNYLSPDMVAWHKNDLPNRMYVNLPGGKKATMPRYYKDKIYSETERETIKKAAVQTTANQLSKDLDSYSTIHGLTIAKNTAFENDLTHRVKPTKDNL